MVRRRREELGWVERGRFEERRRGEGGIEERNGGKVSVEGKGLWVMV